MNLAYNRKQYAKLKEELAALKSFPCADCHGVFPPYVMDFDHLDATLKRFDVGRARKYSLDEIKREIAKCELVCANCHRIRTHERRQARWSSGRTPPSQGGDGRVGTGTGYIKDCVPT